MFRSASFFIGTSFTVAVCRYSPQNIFNAKNFNPHKKPISLLNVPICTQGMQRTWWPEAGTIIVTEPYSNLVCTLIGRVFRIDLLFGHVGQILALYWPSNDWKWWFPTIIWKSIHAIQFKLGVYSYWVSVQNWFAVWPRWPNLGHLVATKWRKMVVSDHYLKKHSCNPIQTWCVYLLGECSELMRFWQCWPDFGPLVATKVLKMVVSDHYLGKYSLNSIQIWCAHLLGECSELICCLAMLAKFWHSSGHKMTENGGYQP